MRRRTSWHRVALVAALAVGAAACGDDDPAAPPAGALSEAEAEVMMEALADAGGLALGGFAGFGAAAPSRAPFGPEPIQETLSCPEGGSLSLDGSISGDMSQDGTGSWEYTLTQTHQSCRSTAEADGSIWTFDGDPSLTLDMRMVLGETSFSMDGTQQGAIGWSSEGRSGSCDIDVTYSFSGSQTGQSFSGSVSGTVCGHPVDESLSIDG